MANDLQKASIWKRGSAWLFDTILLATAVVGFMLMISLITNYQSYSDTHLQRQQFHAQQMGMSMDKLDSYTQEQIAALEKSIMADPVAMHAYEMTINLFLIMISGGFMLAYLLLEFAVPLLFGNGMTVGKKIFGVGLMKDSGVKINAVTLFVRTFLGKFTLETMIPVLLIILILFGNLGLLGTLVILGILVLQIGLIIATQTNSAIHDLLAKTVAVDYASQMIFATEEDAVEYKKRIAAEKAAQKQY